METIQIEKKEKWWIARYKTLDIVAQGETKEKAMQNLFDCIILHIDYAVQTGNMHNLLPPNNQTQPIEKLEITCEKLFEILDNNLTAGGKTINNKLYMLATHREIANILRDCGVIIYK